MDKAIEEILVDKGIITPQQLTEAVSQKNPGEHIYQSIVRLGLAKPKDVFSVLSTSTGIKYIELRNQKIQQACLEKVSPKIALHYKFIPLKFEAGKLMLVMSDPLDVNKLDELKILLDVEIEPVWGQEDDILEAIQRYYGMGAEILEEMVARSDIKERIDKKSKNVQDLEEVVEEASIIKFVNQILSQAVDERATDIHLEPFENELRVRFRIDGFLYDVPIPDSIKYFHQSIVSRVKIMSNLDIAEHRLPQDGRIKIRVKGEELDLRVSILPTAYGEGLQIRILSSKSFLSLENLGLSQEDSQIIHKLVERPYGIIFVTGPTGSGKSTTLYAALSRKNTPLIKIVTIEDPVEYQIRGILQIQVNPRISLNFAEGLRSILRHDPDIIMVGEVRDPETAEITIRSAMTGHLVFSTLHTNDAFGAPTRLIDMGIEPFLVASSLEGIIAQRLVRIVCSKCKSKKTMPSKVFKEQGIKIEQSDVEVFEGKGCPECRTTGYRGRTGIFEIVLVDEHLRNLIFDRVTSQKVKSEVLLRGGHTLRQDGLNKVLSGITTLEEVMRVT